MDRGRGPGPQRLPASGSNERFIVSPFAAALQLPDGRWSNLVERDQGLFSTWQRRILLWFGVCVLALAPLAYLFARGLAAPVTAFARGAERLGRDPGAPPLEIAGPSEVHTAVNAFNKMQDRLRRYVQDRTGHRRRDRPRHANAPDPVALSAGGVFLKTCAAA